jgi:hypothetical protein
LEQKAPARAGLAYPHKIISTWLARQQRRRCPSRFLVKPGGTESEATKSDLDAMKSGFLLAQSAMDFFKASMACSKRTKIKHTRPKRNQEATHYSQTD